MNVMSQMTLRTLKENKRRTIITIIGVIISVAMLTAVATIGTSFLDVFKRSAIQSGGNWHVMYKNVDIEQLETIRGQDSVDDVFIVQDVGFVEVNKEDRYKPYIDVRGYNEKGFGNFPVTLKDGRLPKAEDELVISEAVTSSNVALGDVVTFELGKRIYDDTGEEISEDEPFMVDEEGQVEERLVLDQKRTYTIVGIMESPQWEIPWAAGHIAITYINEEKAAEQSVTAVALYKKLPHSFLGEQEKYGKELGLTENDVRFHYELLRHSGIMRDDKLRKTLITFVGIIMGVIVVGSVSLIYNAFAISVAERSRHLGMLSSVGATKKQKRNAVFFEAGVIGLFSIPIGIIAGIIGIGITFHFLNPYFQDSITEGIALQLIVTPVGVLVASVVAVFTIFISAFIPARRASKITAIDAIRQADDVKLTSKDVKTSRLVRKLFGMEAEIALKNMKRNKRRYHVTVWSLVISIVLFLSVSFFNHTLSKATDMMDSSNNYDIQVSQGSQSDAEWEHLVTGISELEDVTEWQHVQRLNLSAAIAKDMATEELEAIGAYSDDGETYPYNIDIYGLSEEDFTVFANKVGMKMEEFSPSGKTLPVVVINTAQFYDGEANKRVETRAIRANVGDTIAVGNISMEGVPKVLGEIEIRAFTDILPLGVTEPELMELKVIVPDWVIAELEQKLTTIGGSDDVALYNEIYLNATDPLVTEENIEALTTNRLSIYNEQRWVERDKKYTKIISVFTYGFITLITLISVANIFNTISTSIQLRKREFAMLKSMGMTPKGFNQMINYESMIYGVKALLFGLPLSFGVMYLLHWPMMGSFTFTFTPPWLHLCVVILGIFVIVGTAMLYASSKVKKENIIDALKQENI